MLRNISGEIRRIVPQRVVSSCTTAHLYRVDAETDFTIISAGLKGVALAIVQEPYPSASKNSL